MRAALSAAVVALAATVVVAAQPVTEPWWTYADADATYVSASLSLLAGERTTYLDHPGLPLQELLEVALGAQWLASGDERDDWIGETLLDLDRTRLVFRTFAVLFYVGGALLLFALTSSLLRSAFWGTVAGLLWLGAPGLIAMSIQFRPDVLVTALCALATWLVAVGARNRSATWYAAGAFAIGFAITVKLHALGLLVPLLVAFLWRPPAQLDIRAASRRYRGPLLAAGALWATAVLLLNANAVPFSPTAAQVGVGIALAGLLAASSALAARGSSAGLVVAALAAGVALPVTLIVRDGLQALVSIAKTATGGNVNEGISPFENLDRLGQKPLREGLIVLVLAAAAAAVGVLRRDPAPVVFFASAAALGAMALARLADVHYFAPAFAVAVPAALWLLARLRVAGALAAIALVAVVAAPRFLDRWGPAHDFEVVHDRSAPVLAATARTLGPRDVALTPSYYPVADTRWFEVVRPFAPYDEYPYRFLPATPAALETARARGLRVRAAVDVDAGTLARLGLAGLPTFQHDEAPER